MLERFDVPLAPLTTLGLGGPAKRVVTAYDEAEVVAAVRAADQRREPVLVLGGGSNVVLADEGFAGTVVRVASHGLRVGAPAGGSGQQRLDGSAAPVLVEAAAGEDWDALVALCVQDSLAGIECLSGIPGLTGATPVQNAGAYGQDVSQTITSVRVYDRSVGAVVELPAAACGFGYRSSVFKGEDRQVVLAVTFGLSVDPLSAPVRYAELAAALDVSLGERAPLGAVREAVLALRRGKGMVIDALDPDSRSAGSFFTNPVLSAADAETFRARAATVVGEGVRVPEHPEPDGRVKLSAAWLIEHAGFAKGHGEGPVGLSSKHTLALVHRGGGRTADLLAVAREVRDGVREAFGVELVAEPLLLGGSL